MNVSYKPQKISPKFAGTVVQLLHTKIRDSYVHPQFTTDVIKPLQVDKLFDQEVLNLSGGELQRVALTLCLGQVRRERERERNNNYRGFEYFPVILFTYSLLISTSLMSHRLTLIQSSVSLLQRSSRGQPRTLVHTVVNRYQFNVKN